MSIDPDLRIALALLLLLRVGIGLFYAAQPQEAGLLTELRRVNRARPWPRWVVWTLLATPSLVFLLDADGFAWLLSWFHLEIATYSIMGLPDGVRLLLLVPAVIGLLLWIVCSQAALQMRTGEGPLVAPFAKGPYRLLRFPDWFADFLLFGAMSLATDNWVAALLMVVAIGMFDMTCLPRGELAWQRLLGAEYPEHSRRTGAVLPLMPIVGRGGAPCYSVPKRFGISAIIGLVTMFALIFGGINMLQSHLPEFDLTPAMHVFFGLQLMAIWIGQMQFGESPRRISTVIGALLLPSFVTFLMYSSPSRPGVPVVLVLAFVGGILGYCLGAVAAGLFLLIDWFDMRWTSHSR